MIDWSRIDTVLLDMDGTLIDLRFDNQLWNVVVPDRYGERAGLDWGVEILCRDMPAPEAKLDFDVTTI